MTRSNWADHDHESVNQLKDANYIRTIKVTGVAAEDCNFGSNGWRNAQSDCWATVGVVDRDV